MTDAPTALTLDSLEGIEWVKVEWVEKTGSLIALFGVAAVISWGMFAFLLMVLPLVSIASGVWLFVSAVLIIAGQQVTGRQLARVGFGDAGVTFDYTKRRHLLPWAGLASRPTVRPNVSSGGPVRIYSIAFPDYFGKVTVQDISTGIVLRIATDRRCPPWSLSEPFLVNLAADARYETVPAANPQPPIYRRCPKCGNMNAVALTTCPSCGAAVPAT